MAHGGLPGLPASRQVGYTNAGKCGPWTMGDALNSGGGWSSVKKNGWPSVPISNRFFHGFCILHCSVLLGIIRWVVTSNQNCWTNLTTSREDHELRPHRKLWHWLIKGHTLPNKFGIITRHELGISTPHVGKLGDGDGRIFFIMHCLKWPAHAHCNLEPILTHYDYNNPLYHPIVTTHYNSPSRTHFNPFQWRVKCFQISFLCMFHRPETLRPTGSRSTLMNALAQNTEAVGWPWTDLGSLGGPF